MHPPFLLDPTRPAPPPARRLAARRGGRWLPLLLVALIYLAASAGPAIFDQNEGQYAGAAREMLDLPGDYRPAARGQLERGQWLVPTNDGIPRLQKPPLVYWALMASMRVFGVNEFGARLPNALAALLWFGATALLGRRLGGAAWGAAGALVLATMAGAFVFCHLIAPEPYLAAFITLTFWCFTAACQQPERAARWMRGAWLCMALGVFCKGLHGALYPLAVAGLLAWRHPATRPAWRELLRPAGPLLFLAVVAPWYAAMEAKFPGFLRDQFINEQFGHVFDRRYPPDSERVPMLVFWLQHLALFLPWTFFIPAALRSGGGGRTATSSPHAAFGRDLLAGWLAVTAVSVVFSSLQDYYLMTAWGPVALWLARPWLEARRLARLPGWMTVGPGAALGALGLVGFALALGSRSAGGAPDFTHSPDSIMDVVTGFSGAAWARLRPLLWAASACFLVGGALAAHLARRGRGEAALTAVAAMMAAVLWLAGQGMGAVEDGFSLKRAAQAINVRVDADAEVVCLGLPCDHPSLFFYLDRPVHWLDASPAGEFASRELGIGRGLFLEEAEFSRRWADGTRQLCLIAEQAALTADCRRRLGLPPADAPPWMRCGTRVVLVNRPPAGAAPVEIRAPVR